MRVGKSGERGCRLGVPYGFSDESGIVFVSASNDECQSKDCIYEDRDIKACKNIPVNHVNCLIIVINDFINYSNPIIIVSCYKMLS